MSNYDEIGWQMSVEMCHELKKHKFSAILLNMDISIIIALI